MQLIKYCGIVRAEVPDGAVQLNWMRVFNTDEEISKCSASGGDCRIISAFGPCPAMRRLIPRPSQQAAPTPASPGAESYASHCAICHGDRREGILPAFPPLLGIGRQLTDAQITELIHTGKGRMPAFPKVQGEELTELLRFLSSPDMSAPQTSGAQATNAGGNTSPAHPAGLSEAGGALFRQNCAFCHGRDAMGGETGPDLTRVEAGASGSRRRQDLGGNPRRTARKEDAGLQFFQPGAPQPGGFHSRTGGGCGFQEGRTARR